ncbi:MAG: acyl carrier protein [Bacilli bacterium]|nr:acyl carrier protein [Bacilli bacterium]MDD4388826.1 acyl carrier protein [Bacilli bacterium]
MQIEKIKKIFADKFHVLPDEINNDTDLQKDLGADSLDAVELIMTLEDEFDLIIPDNIAQTFKTVGDIFNYLQENE